MAPKLFSGDMPLLVMLVLAGSIAASILILFMARKPAKIYGYRRSFRVFILIFLCQLYGMAHLRHHSLVESLCLRYAPEEFRRTMLLDWSVVAILVFALFLLLKLFGLLRTPVYLLLAYSILAGSACAVVGFMVMT